MTAGGNPFGSPATSCQCNTGIGVVAELAEGHGHALHLSVKQICQLCLFQQCLKKTRIQRTGCCCWAPWVGANSENGWGWHSISHTELSFLLKYFCSWNWKAFHPPVGGLDANRVEGLSGHSSRFIQGSNKRQHTAESQQAAAWKQESKLIMAAWPGVFQGQKTEGRAH